MIVDLNPDLPLTRRMLDSELGRPSLVRTHISTHERQLRQRSISAHQSNERSPHDRFPLTRVKTILALYERPANGRTQAREHRCCTPRTGVGCDASFTPTFVPNSKIGSTPGAWAVLSCDMNITPYAPGVVIRFQRGYRHCSRLSRYRALVVQYKEGESYKLPQGDISKQGIWHDLSGMVRLKANGGATIRAYGVGGVRARSVYFIFKSR